jgi:hypothetical protein
MSQERLAKFAPRVDFALAVYDEIPEVLANLKHRTCTRDFV